MVMETEFETSAWKAASLRQNLSLVSQGHRDRKAASKQQCS